MNLTITFLDTQFHFLGELQKDGRYQIHAEPIDTSDLVEECRNKIARHPAWPWLDDACDGPYHSQDCLLGMEEYRQPCVRIEAKEAEQRLRRLHLRYLLKKSALWPDFANGRNTFDGFASRGLIYDTRTA